MTLEFKHENNEFIYCCSYICNKGVAAVTGERYFHLLVNKEDFDFLRPVLNNKKETNKYSIDNEYDKEQIMDEIYEEERMRQLEEEYYDSSDDYSSEEFYE